MDLKWRASVPSVRCYYLDRAENCYCRYALWIHDGYACKSVGVEFAVRTIRIASKFEIRNGTTNEVAWDANAECRKV